MSRKQNALLSQWEWGPPSNRGVQRGLGQGQHLLSADEPGQMALSFAASLVSWVHTVYTLPPAQLDGVSMVMEMTPE